MDLSSLGGLGSNLLNFGEGLVTANEEQHRAADAASLSYNFSATQAQENRDFQERMSNTQYQRATKDMLAAGLNPMLAYSQGGAGNLPGSTAQGTMAQVPRATPSGGAAFAPTVMGPTTAGQVKVLDQQASNIAADTELKDAQRKEAQARTPTYAVSMDLMRSQTDATVMSIQKIIQDTATSAASAANIQQQTRNLQATLPQIRATIDQLHAQTRLTYEQAQQTHVAAGLTKSQWDETVQRISANLPAAELAYRTVETHLAKLELPAAGMQAATHSTPIGALSAIVKALSPFASFTPRTTNIYK